MSPDPTPGCPPPHPNPKKPDRPLPPLSCDAHCHIFGPADAFPYAATRTFTPPDVSAADLRRRHEHLGFDRAVIVQSACHGTDHAALLDALRTGGDRYRGVALATPDTPAAEIARLHEAGVRGVRVNFLPHLGGAPPPEAIDALVRLVRPFGWHVQVHVAGEGVAELSDVLAGIGPRVVIDHLARVDLRAGVRSPAVSALLRLMDTGNVWVKLSGADRVSLTGPPYHDAADLARLLVDHAPERVLWGTDFPHPNIRGASPDDGALTDLIDRITPTDTHRHRLLVTNPAELYGFPDADIPHPGAQHSDRSG